MVTCGGAEEGRTDGHMSGGVHWGGRYDPGGAGGWYLSGGRFGGLCSRVFNYLVKCQGCYIRATRRVTSTSPLFVRVLLCHALTRVSHRADRKRGRVG